MPLCSNQFFNDLTQSWATSVKLYAKSKGMFDMLWFLVRQESHIITAEMEKQSYRFIKNAAVMGVFITLINV